jgi:hypothetical protein
MKRRRMRPLLTTAAAAPLCLVSTATTAAPKTEIRERAGRKKGRRGRWVPKYLFFCLNDM